MAKPSLETQGMFEHRSALLHCSSSTSCFSQPDRNPPIPQWTGESAPTTRDSKHVFQPLIVQSKAEIYSSSKALLAFQNLLAFWKLPPSLGNPPAFCTGCKMEQKIFQWFWGALKALPQSNTTHFRLIESSAPNHKGFFFFGCSLGKLNNTH